MSGEEYDATHAAVGCVVGLFALMCVVPLALTILGAVVVALEVAAALAVIAGLIYLIAWLADHHPNVLVWAAILIGAGAFFYGGWLLLTWLWATYRFAIEITGLVTLVVLAAWMVSAIAADEKREQEQKAAKALEWEQASERRAREQAAEQKARRQAAEEASHAAWLQGLDLQQEIDDLQRQLEQRLTQLACAKKNARRLGEEIAMHEASADPAQVLDLCKADEIKEHLLIRKLTYDVGRTWTRMTLLAKIRRFTVLLRRVPDLAVLKQASLMDNPTRAKDVYALLWQKLTSLCDQMHHELQDQEILNQRPPLAEEVYPLVDSHLRLAHEQMCMRFDEQLRELAKHVARLHYLEGAAERAVLHREANLEGDSSRWSAEVAEVVQDAVDRLTRTVDEAKRHLADAEVEGATQSTTPRAIKDHDFIDPLELDAFRARRAASKLREPR